MGRRPAEGAGNAGNARREVRAVRDACGARRVDGRGLVERGRARRQSSTRREPSRV